MRKKFLFSAAAVLTAMSTQVSAAYNKYNEADVINVYNNTLQEVAVTSQMSLDEFKNCFGLPEDMPGDTNESAALNNITLKMWIESAGGVFEELLPDLKAIYKGEGEIDENIIYGDFIEKIALKDYYGEENIDEVLKEINTYGVTADTLYGDVRTIVERKLLVSANVLSYAKEDSILVMLNGKYIDFDVAPIIINDRVMVPMRSIFEELGAKVSWVDDTKTIFAVRGEDVITMQVGQNSLFKNEEKIEIDVPSMIENERALVPLRAVAEALDTKVYYNENTKTVVVH